MTGLVRVPREAVVESLTRGLSQVPDAVGAFLFGSILGECRPDSDIDLGVVPRAGAEPFALVGEVEAACRPVEGHALHATALDERNLLFCFRVVSTGELVYCTDRDAVTDLMERVARRYDDVGYMYSRALRDIYGGG